MYSSIFAWSKRKRTGLLRSLSDINSSTKSGQSGAKPSCSSRVKARQRSSRTHEASGPLFAPLGSSNIVFVGNAIPPASVLAQCAKQYENTPFLSPVFVFGG